MFEDFKKVRLVSGFIYFSLTKNGLTFSRNAINQLGSPEYVRLLVNDKTKQVAIQVCDKNEKDKVKFVRDGSDIVRWNNKVFIDSLLKLINQDINKLPYGKIYRVGGEYIPQENAILFNLKDAKEGNRI